MKYMGESIQAKTYQAQGAGGLLFFGVLVYIGVFYSQIAGRFSVLRPFRVELFLGAFVLIFCFQKILRGQVSIHENRLNIAAIFFVFSAFLTIPFAFVKREALGTFIDMLKSFAIYLMIISTIDTEKRLKTFIYVYLAMISLLFVEPFILSLQGKGFIQLGGITRLEGVTGYFRHPNQLGGITAENIAFFYFLFRFQKSAAGKAVLAGLIVIALRVIMLTESRTAFVGVLVTAGMVWLLSKKKVPSFIAILCLCIATWHFAPQDTKERFLTLRGSIGVITEDTSDLSPMERVDSGSMAGRWELIKRSFIVFSENPILGVGLNCFKSVNGRRWGYWFPPHNTLAQVLAEMGIIGLSAFLAVVILTLKNLIESRRISTELGEENPFLYCMSSAVTVCYIGRLIVSMFGQDLYGNYLWIWAGLSVVMLRICKIKGQTAN